MRNLLRKFCENLENLYWKFGKIFDWICENYKI